MLKKSMAVWQIESQIEAKSMQIPNFSTLPVDLFPFLTPGDVMAIGL